MQLGFVSAILAELTFEDVLKFAADEGFACVEPMCWPKGGADRRYAGVTHIDVSNLGDDEAGVGRHVHAARGQVRLVRAVGRHLALGVISRQRAPRPKCARPTSRPLTAAAG